MIFKKFDRGSGRAWDCEAPDCSVVNDLGRWWFMLDLPSEHPLSGDLTESQAQTLLQSTRCFILGNKPGMLIFGTDKTFEAEDDGGYAPHDVWPGFDFDTFEIWIDSGSTYDRIKLEI